MKEIEGDLIEMALDGHFDVIAHGCNCFNTMNSGIVKSMRRYWASIYVADWETLKGDYNKLGTFSIASGDIRTGDIRNSDRILILNCYTQYEYGTDKINVNYDAIRMCMDKINHMYKGKKIGLPLIGCGLAGGDWKIVREIIKNRLTDVDVTIVKFKK